ncbi:MAG: alkaline phosphatase family protein [Candidatus Diapherotrites archaeon]|nr:alkaline phosphatase family protein [Candidatus Diapherotrites archaeon]
MAGKKVFVFGIDGAPPKLVFGEWKKHLPNISRLMEKGAYAKIRSTVPPSTIIAWNALASGRDPGELGVYSYTRFEPQSDGVRLVDSTLKKKPQIWDILSEKGKKSVVLNVPLTFPVRKINGIMVSDFMTPGFKYDCVYPEEFKKEMLELLGGEEYVFDVAGFTGYKKLDVDDLLNRTYKMTEMHFKLMEHCLKNKEWDFFMAVVIGTDRLNHMLWRFFDEKHVNFQGDSPYKNAVRDFYAFVDKKLGELLKLLPDNTSIIVSSDHGMERMDGRVNLNDWLRREGYLVLKKEFENETAEKPARLRLSGIDWQKTKAFAVGGYQGRIYLNRDRKALGHKGILGKDECDWLGGELEKKLLAIRGGKGEKLDNKVFFAKDIYKNGFDDECPEMIVYFDNLVWGVNNDVGNKGLYSTSTTVGSDDAGHAPEGSFVIVDEKIGGRGDMGTISILDVFPTMMDILGEEKPKDLQGKSLLEK